MHNQSRHGAADAPATPRRKLGLPKPKRWNHQDELEALKGKVVFVTPIDGVSQEATLVDADQFAIKMLTATGGTAIIWKHALRSVVEKR